jgi:hypothetical protein
MKEFISFQYGWRLYNSFSLWWIAFTYHSRSSLHIFPIFGPNLRRSCCLLLQVNSCQNLQTIRSYSQRNKWGDLHVISTVQSRNYYLGQQHDHSVVTEGLK